MRPNLIVLDDWEGRLARSEGIARMRELADVRVLDRPLAEVPDGELAGVDVVMAVRERTRFDPATFDRLPALKLVLQSGGHAYHLDAGAARTRGIVVTLGRRGAGPRAAVPELTFALMIGALRGFPTAVRTMDAGGWPAMTGRTLAGRRLGILGTGRHGARVAKLAEAFGMEVVAWARPGSSGADPTIPRLPLAELLGTSDVVSIHLRLSEEVRGLLDARALAQVKPGAVLVNTSRGAILDEAALVDALRDGPLAAAGLDVFDGEPLAADSPLRGLPNALLTPHIGWTVEEVLDEFAAIAADQLAAYLAGSLDPSELLPEAAPL
ncbi:NAD(P)-dependent oxidoreductase [Georgenia subflava]|uniref:D-2-hydroxyacid dehydrogenase family protein n=1 Tax=Georgenia subflava TaxID=1622177 RepID=A0A6N7EI49_9MICO|nr:NAD(P)-dependent oxidoreductase [Georgenia subflava]MPV37809.1 D-2-hydroxyacid dehydrogenase family protein [Georgenia subflava]